MQALLKCLKNVKLWMRLNFFNLYEKKSEIIIIGKPELLDDFDSALGMLVSYSRPSVKNLNVIKTSSFSWDFWGR